MPQKKDRHFAAQTLVRHFQRISLAAGLPFEPAHEQQIQDAVAALYDDAVLTARREMAQAIAASTAERLDA
jgi:hypothetical protein